MSGDGDEVLLGHVLRALQLLQECRSPRLESHREHVDSPVWRFFPREPGLPCVCFTRTRKGGLLVTGIA